MKQWAFFLCMAVVVLVGIPDLSPSAGSSTCVTCHTDGARLKSLVTPPKIGGEGEG